MCFSQICCTEKIRWLLPREMGRTNSVVNTGRPLQRWTHPPATLIRESQEVKDCLLGNCHENQPVAPTPRGGGRGETAQSGKAWDPSRAFFSHPLRGDLCLNLGLGCQRRSHHACSPRDRTGKRARETRQGFRMGRRALRLLTSDCL